MSILSSISHKNEFSFLKKGCGQRGSNARVAESTTPALRAAANNTLTRTLAALESFSSWGSTFRRSYPCIWPSLLNFLRQVQVVRAHDAERSVRSAWIYLGGRHGGGGRGPRLAATWPASPSRRARPFTHRSSVHSPVAAPLSDPGLLVVDGGRR
jgi:hypothetical protein